jgi:hypothetical protein
MNRPAILCASLVLILGKRLDQPESEIHFVAAISGG